MLLQDLQIHFQNSPFPPLLLGNVRINFPLAHFIWKVGLCDFVDCKLNEMFELSFDQSLCRIVDVLSFMR